MTEEHSCPHCGNSLDQSYNCPTHGYVFRELMEDKFAKSPGLCPRCGRDLQQDYNCLEHGNVYEEFLANRSRGSSIEDNQHWFVRNVSIPLAMGIMAIKAAALMPFIALIAIVEKIVPGGKR